MRWFHGESSAHGRQLAGGNLSGEWNSPERAVGGVRVSPRAPESLPEFESAATTRQRDGNQRCRQRRSTRFEPS